MGVHDGHRDRMRERFLREGLGDFEAHTVLEMLLYYARPRCNTNEIAHALIHRFGSFSGVLDASMEDLQDVEGIGYTSAVLIKMIPQLAGYYMMDKVQPGEIINSTEKAGMFFVPRFVGKTSESLYMAALDDKRKLLRCACLEREGSVNAVAISIKKIVGEAVKSNATGVLLAHNHPGGVALPSASDKRMTIQVYEALRYINIELVDHIIVADDDFVSLRDSGFFEEIEEEYR